MNDIIYAVSVDVNNPIIPYNVYVANVLDSNVRCLEITLYQNGNVIVLSNEATATASLVTDDVLIDDSVECTISNNIITVPLEDLQRHGNLDVQVTVTEGTKVLAIPFPIQVRVTPNIAEEAQIDENSLGSYAEVVHEIAEARGTYTTLHDAITAKAPLSTAYTFDTTTTSVVHNANNPKTIYLNATVDGEAGIVITAKDNGFQYFLGRRGTLKIRYSTGGTSYSNWTQVIEYVDNKRNAITDANKMSEKYYPSIKAVADALSSKAPAATAFTFDDTTTTVTFNENNPKTIYLNATVGSPDNEKGIVLTSADNTVQYFFGASKSVKVRNKNGASTYTPWEIALEKVGNKKNIINSTNLSSTEFYPSIKAVVDYLAANYEALSNKLTSAYGIDEDSTDAQYPTAKAVYEFGAEIVDVVGEDISATDAAIADLKTYLGYTSGDILGLCADFENKVFTRLGAAVGKTAGSDFNAFPMYGGRRRVVVDSDSEIDESIAPASVTETDYDLDVMVYQPKFYYKVVPLKLEKQSSGLGYHIRKANYYITSTPHAGFKVHPLFIDANGNEVDYVLFSAYEASYLHAETRNYHYFSDGTDTNTNIDWAHDVLKSMPGVKPISGQYKAMNRVNMENLAQRKSTDWHLDTIQSVCANQLLMAIEYGSFNTQTALGNGVVSNSSSGSNNCSSITGSTSAAAFNTASGMASETIYDVAGTQTAFSANGKVAVSYRGMENPWGNIWKHVNGINIWGDGSMNGGQVYICSNYSFNEESHSGNYKSAGFTIANSNGQISAFGYGDENCDWLFMPSETTGNSSLPVSDYFWCSSNLNSDQSGYKVAPFGGRWSDGTNAGGYYWRCNSTAGIKDYYIGGRLLFVPAATV